ncbi:MAG: FAD/NAD(P)-binding protein [Bacteroidetes bacterium]|nr:FAD/NAD(P)-binding protein [Bacteroidota bacterium]MBS1648270.1 FAD/NAD(P)-binding protein [Bacteroidota bacterium]
MSISTANNITIIGGGASASLVIINFVQSIQQSQTLSKPYNITVINQDEEFWKGIAWGNKSSINGLILTSVNEFLADPDKELFCNWVKETLPEWTNYYQQNGGLLATQWLKKNIPLIQKNDWNNIYIPRFLFGNYLQLQLNNALQYAANNNIIISKIIGKAVNIHQQNNNSYKIIIQNKSKETTEIISEKVVVTIGSAPQKKLFNESSNKVLCINNLYEQNINENLQLLKNKLINDELKNILVIGTNATALELIYLLEEDKLFNKLINKIVFISTSGKFPLATAKQQAANVYAPHLSKIIEENKYTINCLITAAANDLQLSAATHVQMDTVHYIIKTVKHLLLNLSWKDQEMFMAVHGNELSKIVRHAGEEYLTPLYNGINTKKIEIIKGSFENISTTNHIAQLTYKNEENNLTTHNTPFSVVINCSGSSDLHYTESELLHNLINSNLCKINLSNKGIQVNDCFEASPNIYFFGPLLNGNYTAAIPYWQLESISRIIKLAPKLVSCLLQKS